jgi:hypothetical protein
MGKWFLRVKGTYRLHLEGSKVKQAKENGK